MEAIQRLKPKQPAFYDFSAEAQAALEALKREIERRERLAQSDDKIKPAA
jgi:hypothetical protein